MNNAARSVRRRNSWAQKHVSIAVACLCICAGRLVKATRGVSFAVTDCRSYTRSGLLLAATHRVANDSGSSTYSNSKIAESNHDCRVLGIWREFRRRHSGRVTLVWRRRWRHDSKSRRTSLVGGVIRRGLTMDRRGSVSSRRCPSRLVRSPVNPRVWHRRHCRRFALILLICLILLQPSFCFKWLWVGYNHNISHTLYFLLFFATRNDSSAMQNKHHYLC